MSGKALANADDVDLEAAPFDAMDRRALPERDRSTPWPGVTSLGDERDRDGALVLDVRQIVHVARSTGLRVELGRESHGSDALRLAAILGNDVLRLFVAVLDDDRGRDGALEFERTILDGQVLR